MYPVLELSVRAVQEQTKPSIQLIFIENNL